MHLKPIILRLSIIFFLSIVSIDIDCQTLNEQSNTIVQGNFKNYKLMDTLSIIEIKRYVIDFDYDNQLDTLILENLKSLVKDPQFFTILDLRLSNGNKYILKNIAGKNVDPQTKINFTNRLNTNLIYIPELKNRESLIFVWDFQYPDCSAQFEILKFDKNGFNQLYNKDMYMKHIYSLDDSNIVFLKGKEGCEGTLITEKVRIK